jgi:hypothetical protein
VRWEEQTKNVGESVAALFLSTCFRTQDHTVSPCTYLHVISSVRVESRQESAADYSQRMIQPGKVGTNVLIHGKGFGGDHAATAHYSLAAACVVRHGIRHCLSFRRNASVGLQWDLAEITSGSGWSLIVGTFPVGSIVSLLSSTLTQSEKYNVSCVFQTIAIQEPRTYVFNVVEVAGRPQASILGQDHRRR